PSSILIYTLSLHDALPIFPVTIFSGILITGLIFFSNALIKLSLVFARFLVVIITIGLAAAAFEFLTGIVIIPGMAPIMDGIEVRSEEHTSELQSRFDLVCR